MDEVVAFERRLVRKARVRAGETTSSGLTVILRHVAERRSRRSRDSNGDEPRGLDASAEEEPTTGSPGEVIAVEHVAPAVRILRIGRPPPLRFRAGQHLKLAVPGHRAGSFSIASAPQERTLEFCVELVPGGRLTPVLFSLTRGDRVEVADRAKGGFALHARTTRHLMIATVTGIAPLRSMIRDALHRGLDAEFIVLHGASYADELPYAAELTALAAANGRVHYRPTVSRPAESRNAGWRREIGRVDELATRVAHDLEPGDTHVYACGNSAMVERVVSELGAAGFEVSTESFD